MNKTLFLIFSAAIFIFSVICICSAPIINKVFINAYNSLDWGYLNCQKESDDYKIAKEAANALSGDVKDKYLKLAKKPLNLCNRNKAVYGLEHSSLIIDIILGFLCLILGLLHYFDVGKPFEKITGIIGLATGIIQFILTFIYICYSGYIFTNDGPKSSSLLKADSDGVFATWDGSKYKCDFYDKDDEEALYAKYSDLGKKIYNYDKDVEQAASTDAVIKCQHTVSNYVDTCNAGEGYLSISKVPDCDKLYVSRTDKVENKYLYDRWVTTIVFSCFIIACDIGLAIFGFFLFKSDGSGI
jgi:hypothetical protein